jgi:hypothetical protein
MTFLMVVGRVNVSSESKSEPVEVATAVDEDVNAT